jgi:hypothetical protein
MFMAALVAIAKIWKPPRGPSVGEWQNILCIQTMDYYLELIKNELSSHENTCKKLQCMLLSDSNYTTILEKAKLCRQSKCQ